MAEKRVGVVTHYYGRISVATMKLAGALQVGDTIHIVGKGTELTQAVASMQIEHDAVEKAAAGQEVGLKVEGRVREGDVVYLVGD